MATAAETTCSSAHRRSIQRMSGHALHKPVTQYRIVLNDHLGECRWEAWKHHKVHNHRQAEREDAIGSL